MAATPTMRIRLVRLLAWLATPVLAVSAVLAQTPPARPDAVIPSNAAVLEGVPRVRIDTTQDHVTRRELDAAEAARSRLTITIRDGQLYRGDRTGTPLTITTSDGFTYLSSSRPGRYIRIQRLHDTLSYIEHVDMAFGSVTYWGELRVAVTK
jgi:hypothetical protein